MKSIVTFFVLALLAGAQAENQFFRQPQATPKSMGMCELQVNITQFPVEGRFYLMYTVNTALSEVRLAVDKRAIKLKPGTNYQNGLGQVLDPLAPLPATSISAFYGEERHCTGSPFNITKFINANYGNRVYQLIYYRKPKPKEMKINFRRSSFKRRVAFIYKLFASEERKKILIETYRRQFLGNSPRVPALDLKKGERELLVGFLSSDDYYNVNGGQPMGYVYALYRDLLQRSPTPDEAKLLVSQIQFKIPREKLVAHVMKDQSYVYQLIQNWWASYYQRYPSETELASSLREFRAGMAWEVIQANLLAKDDLFKSWALSAVQ